MLFFILVDCFGFLSFWLVVLCFFWLIVLGFLPFGWLFCFVFLVDCFEDLFLLVGCVVLYFG